MTEKSSFPWDLGVYDAHCHPTDTMTSIAQIPEMKATTLTVMATRGQDQDLVAQITDSWCLDGLDNNQKHARVIPCFGWHPWFSYQLFIDDDDADAASSSDLSSAERKSAHYKKVLTSSLKDEDFIAAMPDPKPISRFISETRERLLAYPTALVGEIGLDRSFRLPNPWTKQELENRNESLTPGSREGRPLSPYRVHMDHQKAVLKAQLRLAGELRRAVSVHSVQAHGAVFDVLKELWAGHERKRPSRREMRRRRSAELAHADSDIDEDSKLHKPQATHYPVHPSKVQPSLPFPPRICMHSYSGPPEPIAQFMNPSIPSDVYFSFSSVINLSGPSAQKANDTIKALPEDRLLIESDLHTAGPVMDEMLEEVTRHICTLRGWPLHEGVQRLAENWKRFVFG